MVTATPKISTQIANKILSEAIIYPDSDGKPMSDNTLQFYWIQFLEQNLEWCFAADPDVFVIGDLLWYPVEGNNKIRQAPDVMVIFGRPKDYRGSYQQWKEDNIAPQVAFEILSPGNSPKEMSQKHLFYSMYGVEEYYLYNPARNTLQGWLRSQGNLEKIETLENWVSPRLGIRFDPSTTPLSLYLPNGEPFIDFIESQRQAQKAQLKAQKAQLKARKAQLKAQKAQLQTQEERDRADRLAQRLRELGINPDEVS
jgi:hypothetical protein